VFVGNGKGEKEFDVTLVLVLAFSCHFGPLLLFVHLE
jgi:hypothetical protein